MRNRFFKRFAVAVLLVMMAVIPTFTSYAAEKNVSVNLDARAKDITFKITFSRAGNYTATLTGPNGDTYEYANVDGVTYTCDIDTAEAGEWVTSVSASGDVPKYSLSVNAKKETSTSKVSDAVSVGRDIIGLQVYFKDNTVCISWADASIGKVEVDVTNLDTSEVIFEEDITETHCECELPEGVKNVSVSVVPTESRNVDGAKSVYTFAIPNRPTSTVTYDAGEYINKSSIDVSIHLDNTYSFYAEVNGRQAYKDGENPAGDYDISIPVNTEGENEVAFYLVDADNNMYSFRKTVILDTTAPTLELEREYDQASTSEMSVSINGNIKDYDTFTINGENVEVTSDGTFSHPVTLHVGDNTFDIIASDKAGNETAYHVTIIGLQPRSSVNPMVIIGAVVGLLVIIGVVVVSKKIAKPKAADLSIKTPVEEKANNKPSNLPSDSPKSVLGKSDRGRKEKVIKKANRVSTKNPKSTGLMNNINKKMVVGMIVYTVALLILLNGILMIDKVASGSMEPTLMTGDVCIDNRLAYVVREPQRGDIITFKSREKNTLMGKRIIGVAGDHIEFHDGYVYLNGELLDESAYLNEDVETNCISTFDVPDGCVFVMGDNREKSTDSRFWENPYINVKDIKAKYMFSIPLSKVF